MKNISLIAAILSGLLLFSQVLCGLWIRNAGKPADESSIRFHVMFGLLTVAVVAVTLVINMIAIYQRSA